MRKKLLPTPTFKTTAEEAEFWDTHDSAEYKWEEAKDIKFSKNLKSVYVQVMPIKVDAQISKAIEKVAKEKGTDTSTAAGILLRERLSELKAL